MIAIENFTSPAVMQAMGDNLQINMLKVTHIKDIMVGCEQADKKLEQLHW